MSTGVVFSPIACKPIQQQVEDDMSEACMRFFLSTHKTQLELGEILELSHILHDTSTKTENKIITYSIQHHYRYISLRKGDIVILTLKRFLDPKLYVYTKSSGPAQTGTILVVNNQCRHTVRASKLCPHYSLSHSKTT